MCEVCHDSKDMFQVFDQLVILSRSAESEDAAACRSEGWEMVRQRVESSKRKRGFSRVREIINENHKHHRAQNTALRNSILDRKRR